MHHYSNLLPSQTIFNTNSKIQIVRKIMQSVENAKYWLTILLFFTFICPLFHKMPTFYNIIDFKNKIIIITEQFRDNKMNIDMETDTQQQTSMVDIHDRIINTNTILQINKLKTNLNQQLNNDNNKILNN